MKVLLILLAVAVIFNGCKKDQPVQPVDLGYAYYPLTIGSTWIFQSDSIVWDDFSGTVDTSTFFLKETISEEFEDLEGRKSVRLERFKSRSDTLNWALKDVWYITRTSMALEVVEEDVRFLRLIFPPQQGKNWDSNEMNTLPELTYEVSESGEFLNPANGLNYDSTVTIKTIDSGSLISISDHEWIFARNTGPVKRLVTELETEVNGTIKSGYIYKQELITFRP